MNLLRSLVGEAKHINPLRQIISPYLTKFAVQSLKPYFSGDISLVTLFDRDVFACFSSDISALRYAFDVGIKLYSVDNLHAKAYVFRDFCFIGSANCTNRGLGLAPCAHANVEILAPVSHSEILTQLQQIKHMSKPIHENDLAQMEKHLLLTGTSRCASANRAEITDCLEQAVFPTRQPFSLYLDAISFESNTSLPASSRLSMREELSEFGISECFGSESSLKRQLFDFLNSQYHIRCLLSCLDSNNTLAIKMLDGRHSASYWIDWMKAINI